MIPVRKVAAPAGYRKVKQRGDAWLRKHRRARRPKDLWSPFLPHLAEVQWRRRYYERYEAGQLSLDGLRVFAPLVADAVEREQRRATRATPRKKQRR